MVDGIHIPPPIVPVQVKPTASPDVRINIRNEKYADLQAKEKKQHEQKRRRKQGANNPYGATSDAAETTDSQSETEIIIDQSTAMLVAGDLTHTIEIAARNVGRLAELLLDASEDISTVLGYKFRNECIGIVEQAVNSRRKDIAARGTTPQVIAFTNLRIKIGRDQHDLMLELGEAQFRYDKDMRAKGIVFDIYGTTPVHAAEAGVLVDIGANGAATADHFIEKVRNAGRGSRVKIDTEDACILIRAEKSDYTAVDATGGTLDFDLLIPLQSWSDQPGASRATRPIGGVNFET